MFLVLAFVQKKQHPSEEANSSRASVRLHSNVSPFVTLTTGIVISSVAFGFDVPLSWFGYAFGGIFLAFGIAGMVRKFFGKQ